MAEETVTHKPLWQQKTFWAGLVAFALSLPSLVDQIGVLLPPHIKEKALAWAAVAAALAAYFSRMGGVDAAKKVEQSIELVDNGLSLKEALAADRQNGERDGD